MEMGTTVKLCCFTCCAYPNPVTCLPLRKPSDTWLKLSQDLGSRSHMEEKICFVNVIHRKMDSKWRLLPTNLTRKILKGKNKLVFTALISVSLAVLGRYVVNSFVFLGWVLLCVVIFSGFSVCMFFCGMGWFFLFFFFNKKSRDGKMKHR